MNTIDIKLEILRTVAGNVPDANLAEACKSFYEWVIKDSAFERANVTIPPPFPQDRVNNPA